MDDYKQLFKVFVVTLGALLALSFGKDQALRIIIEKKISASFEAPVKIGEFTLGVWHHRIVIKKLRIFDPKSFADEIMLDIPEAHATYDFEAFLKGKWIFYQQHLNVRMLIVNRNTNGELNVNYLMAVLNRAEKEKTPITIDRLYLTIEKVVNKKLAFADDFQAFEVGIKGKEFKDIHSLEALTKLILLESLKSTSIEGVNIFYDR